MTEGHLYLQLHHEILHPNGKIKSNFFKCLCTQNLDEKLLAIQHLPKLCLCFGCQAGFIADGKLQLSKVCICGIVCDSFVVTSNTNLIKATQDSTMIEDLCTNANSNNFIYWYLAV